MSQRARAGARRRRRRGRRRDAAAARVDRPRERGSRGGMWARRWVRRWPGADRLPRWTPGQAHAASLESMSACSRRDVVRIFAIIALLRTTSSWGCTCIDVHGGWPTARRGVPRTVHPLILESAAGSRVLALRPRARPGPPRRDLEATGRARYAGSRIEGDRRCRIEGGWKVSGTFKAHGELRSARTLASRCDERLGWRTFCACVKGARHLQNRSKYSILGSAGRQTAPVNLH